MIWNGFNQNILIQCHFDINEVKLKFNSLQTLPNLNSIKRVCWTWIENSTLSNQTELELAETRNLAPIWTHLRIEQFLVTKSIFQEVDLSNLTSNTFYSGTKRLLGKQNIQSLYLQKGLLFAGGSSVDGTAGKVRNVTTVQLFLKLCKWANLFF